LEIRTQKKRRKKRKRRFKFEEFWLLEEKYKEILETVGVV
jgi:hypothetical protein